ncbi:MAG: nucleoside triphosphate pyrophosphohydrolase [Candidatus Moraniibacteriota bacterium]
MRKEYKKLVRDRIPDIIREKGSVPETRILRETEYLQELKKKFQEELDEYLAADTSEARLEEMADIFEVITALNATEGRSVEQVIETQKKKREDRGAFEERIFLESVEEENNEM